MGEITIRKAMQDDVPAMMEILKFANFHNIPSAEMPDLDYRYYFVAVDGSVIVGLCGYKILSGTHAKTQLMVVHPDWRRHGLGVRLQTVRLEAMLAGGIRTVTTNADLPETIAWYKNHFGYREVGRLRKVHEYGNPAIHMWTTLELDLEAWGRRRGAGNSVPGVKPRTTSA